MPPKKNKNPKGELNIKANIDRLKEMEMKKLVKKNIVSSNKLKKANLYAVWDPQTKQFKTGSMKQISSYLGTTPQTIAKRFKSNDATYGKDVKGFIITRYDDIEKLTDYSNAVKKYDPKIKSTTKATTKKDKEAYLKLLTPNFDLKVKNKVENAFYGTNETQYNISISDDLTFDQIEAMLSQAIENTIKRDNLQPDDKIRFILLDAGAFGGNTEGFSTKMVNVSEMNASLVMDAVGKIENYIEDYSITDATQLIIVTIKPPPEIKAKLKQKYKGPPTKTDKDELVINNLVVNTAMKRSCITIQNKDDLCVPRAIGVGVIIIENGKDSTEYDNAKRGRKIQKEKALELVAEYEILTDTKYDGSGFTISDLEAFEVITGIQITAFDGNNGLNVVYPNVKGEYKPPDDDTKTIYLYLFNGHCDLISNDRVAGFLGSHYFCHKCKKTYSHKGEHKCQFKCNMCCAGNCPSIELMKAKKEIKNWIECNDCQRRFPCKECYDNHKLENTKGVSMCGRVWKCPDCKKILARDTQPPETHVCGDFMCQNCKRVQHKGHQCYMKPKKLNEPSEDYIFFDFEADISDVNHKVMYAVSMYFNSPEPIIHQSLEEWCLWAFHKRHKNHTIIAHNGRGYDFRFIIRWVFLHTQYKPFVIWGGEKIITMSIEDLKIRFIDSLSFLTMPLKKFPKTFGMSEIKKGFFPHWFNTIENWDYEGPVPPKEVFKPERMKPEDAEEFHLWHNEQIENKYVWNQKEEMKAYCISDVDILRRCCIKFRELYLEIADIDPFTYLTIASVCMSIYRYFYIDPTFPQRQKSFDDMKKKFCNNKPQQLKGKKLELWNKFVEKHENENYDAYMGEKKIAIFKYEDVEWMRKAFFGGRTNAVKLIYKFEDTEEGIYSDITSLYPTVNYYDLYPKGHPIIIKENEITDIHYKNILRQEYLGFFDIEIEPPKDLYHPVLPEKGEKLTFDLNTKRGIWCSNEVYVALNKGYKILKVYEIRHFPESTKDLFKGYVGKFLKIKQEASGYPAWVEKPEDEKSDCPDGFKRSGIISLSLEERQNLYIDLYENGQGILMNKNNIKKNAGLRAIAKLCLNSLWGKFGQRTNMGVSKVIDTKEEYFDIMYNPRFENQQMIPLGGSKVEVSYSIKDEYVENDYTTNMAIACFTTSRARMRLYEEALDVLDRQVLYFDTDSVVYKYDPKNEDHIKLENGDLLGEWTDELEGDKMVGTFVSGGPKNYSYELLTPEGKTKYKTKVKGFTLNVETKEHLSHNKILDIIRETLSDEVDTDNHKIEVQWHGIKRDKDFTLANVSMVKRYGLCFTKRQICNFDEKGNVDTLPFGFEGKKERKHGFITLYKD